VSIIKAVSGEKTSLGDDGVLRLDEATYNALAEINMISPEFANKIAAMLVAQARHADKRGAELFESYIEDMRESGINESQAIALPLVLNAVSNDIGIGSRPEEIVSSIERLVGDEHGRINSAEINEVLQLAQKYLADRRMIEAVSPGYRDVEEGHGFSEGPDELAYLINLLRSAAPMPVRTTSQAIEGDLRGVAWWTVGGETSGRDMLHLVNPAELLNNIAMGLYGGGTESGINVDPKLIHSILSAA